MAQTKPDERGVAKERGGNCNIRPEQAAISHEPGAARAEIQLKSD